MGIFSKSGGILNDIMGTTSAGQQSQKYAKESAAINNTYQKEFAQNGIQWAVQDAQKAGINPIFTAASGGANASGGGINSAQVAASGANPIEMGLGVLNGYTNAQETIAKTENLNADTVLKGAQTAMQNLDYAIKNGMSEDIIKKAKADCLAAMKNLEVMNATISDLNASAGLAQETTKKIKQGKVGEIAGTSLVEYGKNKGSEMFQKIKDFF